MPKPRANKLPPSSNQPQEIPAPESPLMLPPPQPAAEELPPPSGSTSAADPDFASIEADLGAAAPAADPAASGFLTKDQFYAGFGGCFTMASAVTRLKSLEISENDRMAREASDAIYDTAIETPMFHFLVRPGNVYVQRSLVILVFAKTKSDMVKAEIAMRRPNRMPANQQDAPIQTVNPATDPTSASFGQGIN